MIINVHVIVKFRSTNIVIYLRNFNVNLLIIAIFLNMYPLLRTVLIILGELGRSIFLRKVLICTIKVLSSTPVSYPQTLAYS